MLWLCKLISEGLFRCFICCCFSWMHELCIQNNLCTKHKHAWFRLMDLSLLLYLFNWQTLAVHSCALLAICVIPWKSNLWPRIENTLFWNHNYQQLALSYRSSLDKILSLCRAQGYGSVCFGQQNQSETGHFICAGSTTQQHNTQYAGPPSCSQHPNKNLFLARVKT